MFEIEVFFLDLTELFWRSTVSKKNLYFLDQNYTYTKLNCLKIQFGII